MNKNENYLLAYLYIKHNPPSKSSKIEIFFKVELKLDIIIIKKKLKVDFFWLYIFIAYKWSI
jgi:hypothetical protein